MGIGFRVKDTLQRAFDVALETRWKAENSLRNAASRGSFFSRYDGLIVRWPRVYDWDWAFKWVDSIRDAFQEQVAFEYADIPQRYERVLQFEVELAGKRHPIALDYADKAVIHERCADASAVYLKMQYQRAGYGRANVLPAGYITGDANVYRYLRPVRELRLSQQFTAEVTGRFGMRFGADIRSRALDLLSRQRRFRFSGGTHLIRYSRHLREIAQAKVCVDLPGNGDFCFRLIDYFAVGSCIVAVRHGNRFPVDLVDGENIVWVKEDLSDLVDTCAELVRDDARRERIALNARRYYDAHLHKRALAELYLTHIVAAARRSDAARVSR